MKFYPSTTSRLFFLKTILFTLFFCSTLVSASTFIREWREKQGELYSVTVHSLTEGSSGNLILTTVQKFCVYDGYHFKYLPYPNHNGKIYETNPGEFWTISSEGFGLQKLISNEWITYRLQKPNRIESVGDFSMAPLSAKAFIINTSRQLMTYNTDTQQIQPILNVDEVPINNFKQLVPDHNGGFWITGSNGVMKLSLSIQAGSVSVDWEDYLFDPDVGYENLDHVLECPNGELFGTVFSKSLQRNILVQLIDSKWKAVQLPTTENVHWGWHDSEGNQWIVAGPTGKYDIIQYNFNLQVQYKKRIYYTFDIFIDTNQSFYLLNPFIRYSRPTWKTPIGFQKFRKEDEIERLNSPVRQIFEDSQNRLWFVCHESLLLFENNHWKIYSFPEGYNSLWYSHQPCGMLRDGRFLVMTAEFDNRRPKNYSLFSFDPRTEQFDQIKHPEGRLISFIAPKKDGRMWVVSRDSIDSKTVRIESFDGNTFQNVAGMENIPRIWKSAMCIYEQENGMVWFGGGMGFGFYSDGKFHPVKKMTFERDTGLRCLLEFSDQTMWLGSSNIMEITELKIEDPEGMKKKYVKDDLASVMNMIQDSTDGSVWVATEYGIYRFKDGSWTLNDENDGLPSNLINTVFEDSQNRIWAGTQQGPRYYDRKVDPDPPIAIIAPADKVYNVTKIAPYGDAQFVFRGIDRWKYTESERLYYSHKVDEEPWSPYETTTTALYQNLNPGDHTFYVRVMDRNWNESKPAKLDFVVLLPWYREPLFIVLASISSILILYFACMAIYHRSEVLKSYIQLQQANDELHELDRMKSVFVSQASHDLRTPLTAIKSSLDNILRGVGGKPNEKHTGLILRAKRSVERLGNLVNDILDLNRIETGRIVLEKADVPFETLVKNVIQENQPSAEQKQISISSEGLSQPCMLFIDGGKIERVVGELISNAIKYTPSYGRVSISLLQCDDQAVLSVQDSGIGMSAEECDKIWERFYRTNASKKLAKGSGLGLSIAKELVELHGGTLSVKSEVVKGTTFTLTLPLKKQTE